MPRVTLSYRRDDSSAAARAIYDRLRGRYGADSVFMDIDAIEFGEDYRKRIHHALGQTDYLLVLVGPRWLGPLANGRNRIDDANDPVRIEVERALEVGLRVVPVLLEQTTMPSADQLPESLSQFPYLNAADVSTGREFDSQMERIMRFIDRTSPVEPPKPAGASVPKAPGTPPRGPNRAVLIAAGVAGVVVSIIIAFVLFRRPAPPVVASVSTIAKPAGVAQAARRPPDRPAPERTQHAAPAATHHPVPRPSHHSTPQPARVPREAEHAAAPRAQLVPKPRIVYVPEPARTAQSVPVAAEPVRAETVVPASDWRGTYSYPRGQGGAPVPMSLVLHFDGQSISGRESEPATFGNGSSTQLYANISGTISERNISFTKTYDGTAGVNHSVEYRGTMASDNRSISGTWSIGSVVGAFSITASGP